MTSPDPPVLDPAALDRLREWGGSRLLTQMVRLFLENAPERMTQIREGDAEDAHRGAHSLKSSAANVGAMEVSSIAARMETQGEEGRPERFRALIPELDAAMDRARSALHETLDDLDDEA